MSRDSLWRHLFSTAVAFLMLMLLLVRSEPTPAWVLWVYPLVGAFLAQAASRTTPSVERIARIQAGTIAAAAIVVLALLINVMLVDMLLYEMAVGALTNGSLFEKAAFFALPLIAVLLWWSLLKRLHRIRTGQIAASS